MKTRSTTLITFAAMAAALIAWGAFAMFAQNVVGAENAREASAADAESAAEREIATLRLHSLARDTKNDRDQLDILTLADVLGIANMIEEVGGYAGVTVKISGATSESAGGQAKLPPGKSAPAIRAINFIAEAEGTFSSLMHAVQLFENLPAIASVQNVELERIQDTAAGSSKSKTPRWRLSARIQVMTTADVSS